MAESNSGPSLFSRAGKSSTQRIQILKNTASALSTECPKKTVPMMPFMPRLKKEEVPKEELDALIEKELRRLQALAEHDKALQETREKQAKTIPFRSPGRDDYFLGAVSNRQKRRDDNPPCGHYNVSYSQVDRSTPPPGDVTLPPGYYEPVPVTRKVPSPTPLSLQTERKLMLPSPSAHEKRFETVSLMPGILSKYARARAPNLSKSLGRAGMMVSVSSPHYDANKEVVMQDLGRAVSFRKMSPRKPLFKPIPDQVEPYDVLYSQIERKVPIKSFAKMPPKDRNPDLPLPTFMQDSTSRIAIGCLSEKTIKMNCTRDSILSPKLSPGEMLRVLNSTSVSKSQDFPFI